MRTLMSRRERFKKNPQTKIPLSKEWQGYLVPLLEEFVEMASEGKNRPEFWQTLSSQKTVESARQLKVQPRYFPLDVLTDFFSSPLLYAGRRLVTVYELIFMSGNLEMVKCAVINMMGFRDPLHFVSNKKQPLHILLMNEDEDFVADIIMWLLEVKVLSFGSYPSSMGVNRTYITKETVDETIVINGLVTAAVRYRRPVLLRRLLDQINSLGTRAPDNKSLIGALCDPLRPAPENLEEIAALVAEFIHQTSDYHIICLGTILSFKVYRAMVLGFLRCRKITTEKGLSEAIGGNFLMWPGEVIKMLIDDLRPFKGFRFLSRCKQVIRELAIQCDTEKFSEAMDVPQFKSMFGESFTLESTIKLEPIGLLENLVKSCVELGQSTSPDVAKQSLPTERHSFNIRDYLYNIENRMVNAVSRETSFRMMLIDRGMVSKAYTPLFHSCPIFGRNSVCVQRGRVTLMPTLSLLLIYLSRSRLGDHSDHQKLIYRAIMSPHIGISIDAETARNSIREEDLGNYDINVLSPLAVLLFAPGLDDYRCPVLRAMRHSRKGLGRELCLSFKAGKDDPVSVLYPLKPTMYDGNLPYLRDMLEHFRNGGRPAPNPYEFDMSCHQGTLLCVIKFGEVLNNDLYHEAIISSYIMACRMMARVEWCCNRVITQGDKEAQRVAEETIKLRLPHIYALMHQQNDEAYQFCVNMFGCPQTPPAQLMQHYRAVEYVNMDDKYGDLFPGKKRKREDNDD